MHEGTVGLDLLARPMKKAWQREIVMAHDVYMGNGRTLLEKRMKPLASETVRLRPGTFCGGSGM